MLGQKTLPADDLRGPHINWVGLEVSARQRTVGPYRNPVRRMLIQEKMDYKSGNGMSFPGLITLSDSESSILRQRLFASLGVDGHKPGKEIGELFFRNFKEIATSIPIGDDALLYNAVTDFCGYDPVVVFINFYEFDAINVISLKQLSRVLNDIWLPGAEDIDIFDATFSWVVQVNHEEILLALRAE